MTRVGAHLLIWNYQWVYNPHLSLSVAIFNHDISGGGGGGVYVLWGGKRWTSFLMWWMRQKTNRHLVFSLPNIRSKSVLKLWDLIALEDNASAPFWSWTEFWLNLRAESVPLNQSNYYSFVSDIKSGCQGIAGVPVSFGKQIDALELVALTGITVFET